MRHLAVHWVSCNSSMSCNRSNRSCTIMIWAISAAAHILGDGNPEVLAQVAQEANGAAASAALQFGRVPTLLGCDVSMLICHETQALRPRAL